MWYKRDFNSHPTHQNDGHSGRITHRQHFNEGLQFPERTRSDQGRLGTAGVRNYLADTTSGRNENRPWRNEYNPKSGLHRGKGPHSYKRSDERLKEIVCDQLTDDPDVDASDIEVNVHNSEVILTGTVSDKFSKRFAEHIVESVSGVTQIQNNLRVREQNRKDGGRPMNLRSKTRETFR